MVIKGDTRSLDSGSYGGRAFCSLGLGVRTDGYEGGWDVILAVSACCLQWKPAFFMIYTTKSPTTPVL